MAEKINPAVEDLAEKYAIAAQSARPQLDPRQTAIAGFRAAEAFLAVRDMHREGKLTTEKAKGPQLADCCSPNLPRTHPYNMVSSRFGNLDRVAKVKAWLDSHPNPESEQEQLIPDLNRAFPEISWDLATINLARSIFPAYCAN